MGNGRSFTKDMQPVPSPAPVQNRVPPSPVPLAISLGQVQGPDGSLGVMLEMSTPVGVGVYFLTPEGAVSLGEQLAGIGRAGSAGLVVPA